MGRNERLGLVKSRETQAPRALFERPNAPEALARRASRSPPEICGMGSGSEIVRGGAAMWSLLERRRAFPRPGGRVYLRPAIHENGRKEGR